MSSELSPTWVLLAEVPLATLTKVIEDGPSAAQWRLVAGSGKVNALVDDEPGTEHSGERELAESLSQQARCYVAYFDPPWVSICEKGQWVEERAADPFALAQSLGCALRPEPAPFEAPFEAPPLSALVVQGASAQGLANALDWPWPLPADDARKIKTVALGAAAWEDGGDLVDLALRTARQLKLPLYAVEWRADKALRCQFIQDAEVVSAYDHPSTWWSQDPARMPSVLGHTEPAEILAALGLPTVAT